MTLAPIHLPRALAALIQDCTWQATHGCSGAAVYRLTRPDGSQIYLKTGLTDPNRSLAAEYAKLRWLAGKLPVPQVYQFVEEAGAEYLLMSAIAGLDTSDHAYAADVPAMVRQLAAALRLFHNVPIDECPFDERLNVKLAAARARAAAGLVDADDFGEHFQGRTVADCLLELERQQPKPEGLVFTHGDYCLPNVLLQHGQLSGFIDLGRAGVADRYQDLALGARSLARNFGAEWVPLFFASYGIKPDPDKITYYQLLDEFF